MTTSANSVLDLLTYIEEVEKLKRKPVYTVPTEFFCAHQVELKGLSELKANLIEAGDDVWLRVPRLLELVAPELPAKLMNLVVVSKSADKGPVWVTPPVIEQQPGASFELLLTPTSEEKALLDWYVEFQWTPWSLAEKSRRKTISLYNKLFLLYQTMSSDGADNPLELVWGVGMAAWKKPGAANKVQHPLLTQICEISLNENTFALDIRPREAQPKLELDCYAELELAGVAPLEALWREMQSTSQESLNPFELESFAPILRLAVGQLDPQGSFQARTTDLALPTPSDSLCITSTWVVFARKRSGDVFLEDVQRLKKVVAANATIPAVIEDFVKLGDSEIKFQAEIAFRGLSSSNPSSSARELYFPLPYNDEQVSIVRKLELNNGVVVQGPPGTGKTHTIANIICHYLAQGKRVLVTSKGETALAVLQEKLPERIRALSVALLSDERDGMRQFEHSIQKIAAEISAIQPLQLESNIAKLEQELQQLHARISVVDQEIAQDASQNMQQYEFQGKSLTLEGLAHIVQDQKEDHLWFTDSLAADSTCPDIGDEVIQSLRHARLQAKTDLAYVGVNLPDTSMLASWATLLPLHHDLARARKIEQDVKSGVVLALRDALPSTLELASELQPFLVSYIALEASVPGDALRNKFRELGMQDPMLISLLSLGVQSSKLELERKTLLSKAVVCADGAEHLADVMHAVARLSAGSSAFALPFGKSEARRILGAVTVLGAAPATAVAWQVVSQVLNWRLAAASLMSSFLALAPEFELTVSVNGGLDSQIRLACAQASTISAAAQLVFVYEGELSSRVESVFGSDCLSQTGYPDQGQLAALASSLSAHLTRSRFGYALAQVDALVAQLEGTAGEVTTQIRHFLQIRVGSSESEVTLQSSWLMHVENVARLAQLQPFFAIIGNISAEVKAAGAIQWSRALLTSLPTTDFDPVVPANWREAWAWNAASTLLAQLDVHFLILAKFAERRELTTRLARTYQDLVADKTWLGVYNNSPASIRQSLQAYLNSVQAMGAGTGLRAMRHRRNAREAMVKAYQAVPCWVLPQWRVSETLPAELGLFDLVVVDEASQSDIWALPALLRGKKLLVVGDHKQVSPSVVGLAEQKILDVERRFLAEQPHGRHMTPDQSIYDLARVVFAGNSVMLKEHFRCVPAIIEYSNREFYEGEIKPLRVPSVAERLDPPLIDVYVKGGYRAGDKNPTEAQAIIDEIKLVLGDATLSGRSIGVVTLLGTEQAKLIHELIYAQISPEAIVARKLVVGPPPFFQGRERDIMMVSMVLAPGDKTAANSRGQQQRFNVAMSRARDRTYLFRSVGDDAFPPDSLSGRLLRHFKQPFMQDSAALGGSKELCESGFERDMFDELTSRGYRVRPQVPCGGYRLDLVVEGAEGRRLAIECDGDRFHGPGQWDADMARQRILERAGWTFWRCFASSYVRRRSEILSDLISTLDGLGIGAMASNEVEASSWVHAKTVDPLNVTNRGGV